MQDNQIKIVSTPFAALEKQSSVTTDDAGQPSTINKSEATAFAQLGLEKEAKPWLNTAVRRGAEFLSRSGRAANKAKPGAGKFRRGAAGYGHRGANGLENSPRVAKALNYGIPAAGILGYGEIRGNQRYGTGREEGVTEGLDVGTQIGARTALQGIPGDPGIVGRLLNVFRGQQQGPTMADLQSALDSQRKLALPAILAGKS